MAAPESQGWNVLNEVLSLNAQESTTPFAIENNIMFLNEVLSLNAQEYGFEYCGEVEVLSSMKS